MRLLTVSAFFVAGIAVSQVWEIPIASAVLFLVGTCALAVLSKLRGWRLLLPMALLFMLLGVLRVDTMAPPPTGFQQWMGLEAVKMQGMVVEAPEPRGSVVRFRFHVERINPGDGWRDVSSDILVIATPSLHLSQEHSARFVRYGDNLELVGSLNSAPIYADFDYGEYLARQGIVAIMGLPDVAFIS